MGQIAGHEFMSLDGVIEDPRWTAAYPFDTKMVEQIGALRQASEGIMLGRRTYEMFAPAWSGRTAEDDPGAPFFNATPKYVVSSTLDSTHAWQNSTLLGPYAPRAVAALKDQVDGNIYISGSGTLVRALLS